LDYDALNRKIGATYPTDATGVTRTETYTYDIAGNLALYKNPAGQYKHLNFADSYDSRNRLRHTGWNSSATTISADWSLGQEVTTSYDNASRLTSVTTNGGATAVSFGYDAANRQIWEDQTLAGYPTRHVATDRDSDGNRADLVVTTNGTPNYTITFDYTQRNQLSHIYPAGTVPWFTYTYDLNGNMIKRQDVLGGGNDSTNIIDANGVSQYDPLNRPIMWEQTGTINGTHDSAFARSHFQYDKLGRLTASWRDEQGGKGEWYGYHVTGPLTGVAYNADGVSTGAPQNATRSVDYFLTPDTLNRSVMNDSGEPSSYTPNALNQYTDINGGGLYYDGNFNLMWTGGFSAGYDADKRLTAIGSGEDYGQFVYDGLGRCLKRTIDWETTLIAYDGWKPIVEWDEWNNEKAWNIYGSGPDEILYRHDFARGDLRYHLDRMGNVAFLLDSDGDGIERYTYDAFGTPTVTDWDGNNPRPYSWYGNRFMFTGREYFPELGLYDYRNRFYHPVLGRFLQSDPVGFGGGDANLFRFCGGDPVNRIDPTGMADKDPPDDKPIVPIKPYEPTTTTVIVRDTPIFDINEPFRDMQGWFNANTARGMLGFPSLNNSAGGFDWFGGTPFTFGKLQPLVSSTSFATQTILPQSLPVQPSLFPASSGVLGTASAMSGWGEGIAAEYSLYRGNFPDGSSDTFQSYGGFFGGPSGSVRLADGDRRTSVWGFGAPGVSGGIWVSNATSSSQLMGPFNALNLTTPGGNWNLSWANGVYVTSLTFPGSGWGFGWYPTNTAPPPWGHR
jgi:RHS repeat-associated protein